MRIGIDARFLTHPQVGGFKTYTCNLVSALAALDGTNQYVAYVDRPPATDLPGGANFSHPILRATLPAVGMLLREQVRLPWRASRDRLDLLHCLCNTSPLKAGVKWILTLHDIIQLTSRPRLRSARSPAALRGWMMTTYARMTISRAPRSVSRIITPSAFEREQIIAQTQVPFNRISVTPLAADPVFSPAESAARDAWRRTARDEYGLPERFVLGIGYEARKNIPLLMDAFSRVTERHRDVGLVIVAAVEERRRAFARLACELGLDGRTVLLGPLPPRRLAWLYNLAEAFVFPSERESFGLPPLEAMSCGLPTIAMNATSIPEVVQDAGVLIDGREPRTWGDAIDAVLDDPAMKADLARRGLQRASELTWRRCAEETLEIYRAVAAER